MDMQPQDDREDLVWFETLSREDVPRVGGKNASLGEMVRTLGDKGIRVPPGFATTAGAYRRFISANNLQDRLAERLRR